jgi:hypothetical protein
MKIVVTFNLKDFEALAQQQTEGRGFRVIASDFHHDLDNTDALELWLEVEEIKDVPPLPEQIIIPETVKPKRKSANLTPEQIKAKLAAMAAGKAKKKMVLAEVKEVAATVAEMYVEEIQPYLNPEVVAPTETPFYG